MTDREKVLHGLSSCGNDCGIPNICEVTECPYREDKAWCVHGLAHDAGMLITELLKAQEARLVTYEDFHSGREDGGEAIPCWKEARSKTRRSGWAVIVYGKMLADREMGVARYWTARPTEAQMQEEAWPGA